MDTSRRARCGASKALAVILALSFGAALSARADTPAAASGDTDEPKSLPQDGLFSSIKQSLREGDQEIVRAHFDLGTPPNVHRYYCLMDPKTHRREPNGVLGDLIARPDGMTGIKSSAVSLYRCDKAEQQGMLVTAGYVIPAHSGTTAAAAAPPPAPAATPALAAAPAPAVTPAPAAIPAPPAAPPPSWRVQSRPHPPQSAPSRPARSTYPASNSACLPTKSRRCSNPRRCANATNGART